MVIYYLYYIILYLLSLLTLKDRRYVPYIACIVFVLLFLLCALRGPGVDRDYGTYIYNAEKMLKRLDYFDFRNLIYYEASYYIFASFSIKILNSMQYFFIFYALIGVWLKLKATTYYTNSFFLSILLYFSSWYLLHEMTQIRAGVAVGILSLSIKDIYDRKPTRFIVKFLIACSFHYSSVFFFPAYFLNPLNIRKYFLLLIIITSFVMAYSGFNIFDNRFISIFSGTKIEEYNFLASANIMKLKVFNGLFLINSLISIILLLNVEKIQKFNKYAILFVKLNSISIIFYLVLSSVPMIAVRIAELYSIVQLFLFPCIIYLFKNKYFGYLFIIILTFIYLFINLSYSQMIYDYRLFFNYV